MKTSCSSSSSTPFSPSCETLPKLPSVFGRVRGIFFNDEIIFLGNVDKDKETLQMCLNWYSYHIEKQQYRLICPYLTTEDDIDVNEHVLMRCDYLSENKEKEKDTKKKKEKEKEITLLSFGGKKKHRLIMHYRTVWDDKSLPSSLSGSLLKYNQWMPLPLLQKIGEEMAHLRAVIGGKEKQLLFLIFYPKHIQVIDLRSFQVICKQFLPIYDNLGGGSCLVKISSSSSDRMILFNDQDGLCIKYNENNRTFEYEELPGLQDIYAYSYLTVENDYVVLFGGYCSEKINTLDKIHVYEIKNQQWSVCACKLPIKNFYSFALCDNDNTWVHILGGYEDWEWSDQHIRIKLEALIGENIPKEPIKSKIKSKETKDEIKGKKETVEEEMLFNEQKMGLFDAEKFEREIKQGKKRHLEGVKLNNKQKRTAYALDEQLLEIIFCYKDNTKHTIPLRFTDDFQRVNEMVAKRQNIDLRKNKLSYKIGARVVTNNSSGSFVQCIFAAVAQENNFIEGSLSMEVIETPIPVSETEREDEKEPNRDSTKVYIPPPLSAGVSLDSMTKTVGIPSLKAVAPTFTKLYPLETFKKSEEIDEKIPIGQEEENNDARVLQSKTIDSNTVREIRIGDRMVLELTRAKPQSFRIQIIEPDKHDNSYLNDVRIKIERVIDEIEEKNEINADLGNTLSKFISPLVIYWKLQEDNKKIETANENENENENNKFKAYWYFRDINRWFTGRENVKLTGRIVDLTGSNEKWLEIYVYGCYEIWVREQVSILGHWVDRSTFNEKFDRDYGNLSEYDMGKFTRGRRPYLLPKGWKRYALYSKRADLDWCVAYHGTEIKNLPSILRDHLANPGTVLSMSGHRLSIRDGHITRDNLFGDNHFTGNLFLSPCINYCTHPAYMISAKIDPNATKYSNMVLMVKVRPESIQENEETIGWEDGRLDPNFSNDKMEWRIRNSEDCIVYGLLIRESTYASDEIWKHKKNLAMNNDKSHLRRDIFELEESMKPPGIFDSILRFFGIRTS